MKDNNYDPTSQIKPIETQYKGYRFRSRLEARWAVFFEKIGIEWKYEPEGFVCDCYANEPPTKYLPDFYLPKTETWVEVKGTNESLNKEKDKLTTMLDFSSPIPGICCSYEVTKNPHSKTAPGLLILGDIPEPIWGITLHPIIQHHKGLIWSWCMFTSTKIDVFPQYMRNQLLSYLTNEDPEEWCIGHKSFETKLASQNIYDAYKSARQARFEHGESP
jgi:hypothetical protein